MTVLNDIVTTTVTPPTTSSTAVSTGYNDNNNNNSNSNSNIVVIDDEVGLVIAVTRDSTGFLYKLYIDSTRARDPESLDSVMVIPIDH